MMSEIALPWVSFDAFLCCCREDLHKVDVMTFCQQKIATSCDLSTQRGRDSSLLWKLLILLCRQNGVRCLMEGAGPCDLRSETSYMSPRCLLIQLLFSGVMYLKSIPFP